MTGRRSSGRRPKARAARGATALTVARPQGERVGLRDCDGHVIFSVTGGVGSMFFSSLEDLHTVNRGGAPYAATVCANVGCRGVACGRLVA